MVQYDAYLRRLAEAVGLMSDWQGIDGRWRQVSSATLRHSLSSLGIQTQSRRQITAALRTIEHGRRATLPPLITTISGQLTCVNGVPGRPATGNLILEGETTERVMKLLHEGSSTMFRAPRRLGYHRLRIGRVETILAVAPAQGTRCADLIVGRRSWGLSAQVYALRRPGDAGIGDFSAVRELAEASAKQGANALAISPVHAQFSADGGHYSPYSPSSRLWLNVLHIDVDAAWAELASEAGKSEATSRRQIGSRSLINWPAVALQKLRHLRRLYIQLTRSDVLKPSQAFGRDFQHFITAGGASLGHHALFETLQAHFLSQSPPLWHWRSWPAAYRNPGSDACKKFQCQRQGDIQFHLFLQWLAARQLNAATTLARASMSIGLICDIAVGPDSGGSEAWAQQPDMLGGLSIGSPPDDFNLQGQNWGITSFSPAGLRASAYRPFIDLLRSSLQYGGGVRLDHILGLNRLWIIPEGASSTDGVYLTYPLRELLHLVALESHRAQAFILGEDLGTVPDGLRSRLRSTGISGMQVLWFQRDGDGFQPPGNWARDAAGMTTTHDLPTVTGWWQGRDLTWRDKVAAKTDSAESKASRRRRRAERQALWASFKAAGLARGPLPARDQDATVLRAAIAFLGQSACDLVLLPLEDILAMREQPNLPGTIDEHPNWRRRLPLSVGNICRDGLVKKRLQHLDRQRRKR
jgi:4-alpha-glucanotransferase